VSPSLMLHKNIAGPYKILGVSGNMKQNLRLPNHIRYLMTEKQTVVMKKVNNILCIFYADISDETLVCRRGLFEWLNISDHAKNICI
jgi:hypothetical protein